VGQGRVGTRKIVYHPALSRKAAFRVFYYELTGYQPAKGQTRGSVGWQPPLLGDGGALNFFFLVILGGRIFVFSRAGLTVINMAKKKTRGRGRRPVTVFFSAKARKMSSEGHQLWHRKRL